MSVTTSGLGSVSIGVSGRTQAQSKFEVAPGRNDFWLNKLNQFNGNFVSAEMVKAFISLGEYRQRFGP